MTTTQNPQSTTPPTFPEVESLIRQDTQGILLAIEELLAEARTRCERAAQATGSSKASVRVVCLTHASVYVKAVSNGLSV